MNPHLLRLLMLLTCVTALVTSCDPPGDRCRKCGMLVDQAPRWVAGLTNAAGKQERFCCERCMLAHLRGPQGAGSHSAWVTEYYTQQRRPIAEVLFVIGSDITGPMGQAMVPIAGRDAAEQFRTDHGGTRMLTSEEITPEVLRAIAGQPATPAAP